MIITTFSAFRDKFATRVQNTYSVTFSAPDFIDDAGADFVTDGYVAGQRIQVIGSASNDGYRIIDTVSTTRITTIEQTVAAEGPVAVSLDAISVDNDGYPSWPIANMRAGGFSAGFTGLGNNYTGETLSITANSGAADSVKGTDEYDWYLSQRTEVASKQVLSISPVPHTATQSFSGTVRVLNTALAQTLYGSTLGDPESVAKLFKACHLYCQRRSDNAIQWIDLHKHFMTV